MSSHQILVVDDDPDVCDLIQDYLSDKGYNVTVAHSGADMRSRLQQSTPDLILLDVGLPGEDGLSLARYAREHLDIAVIMVSGAGETIDRILGLEVGADDYITKPFDPRELVARIKTVMRRYQGRGDTGEAAAVSADGRVRIGRCSLDLTRYQLFDGEDQEVPMTTMEFELLRTFVEHPNRPLSRDQILGFTQNRDWSPYDRSIDIRIARLRKKVEPDPDNPRVIKTVRGVGYMFIPG